MRTVTVILAGLLLASCAAHFDKADHDRCLSYGATRGTPMYTACRLHVEQQRRNAIADAFDGAAGGFQQSRRSPVSCTSNRYGNTVTTNCY